MPEFVRALLVGLSAAVWAAALILIVQLGIREALGRTHRKGDAFGSGLLASLGAIMLWTALTPIT